MLIIGNGKVLTRDPSMPYLADALDEAWSRLKGN